MSFLPDRTFSYHPLHNHHILISSTLETDQFMWGTQMMPIRSQRGSNDIHFHLNMGYLHPDEQHYQTVVLYNRNPVAVTLHVRSPVLPGISFNPVYRAILTNQTLTQASQHTSRN